MFSALRDLWRYRDLAWILVANDLKLRYRRSVIGAAWTMLNPLLTMLILTAVFSHVWRVEVEKFPVFLLSALLPWSFFGQSVTRGAHAIVQNESLLRSVRVPRAIFPIAVVMSNLVNFLLALVPLSLVMIWQGVTPTISVVALPLSLLVLATFTCGVALALSALTVFFRDLAQIVEVSLTALFYLTPVIYPLTILPERYAWAFQLNPLLYQVIPFRSIFFEGRFPSLELMLVSIGSAVASLLVGFAIFRKREDLFLQYLS
ncbi:MAG: ABC transporter permease [bacterium]